MTTVWTIVAFGFAAGVLGVASFAFTRVLRERRR